MRTCLTTTTILHVDPAGTDDVNHGGGTGTGAFKTPGYAVNFACANIDCCGHQLIIDVAPATYTTLAPGSTHAGIVLGDIPGVMPGGWPNHPLLIRGNPSDPANGPLISIANSPAIVGVGANSAWEISGFQLQSTVCDIEADFFSRIYVGNNIHGAVSGAYPTPFKFMAVYGGAIELLGTARIIAGGTNAVFCQNRGFFLGLANVSIDAGVSFSNGTNYCDASSLMA